MMKIKFLIMHPDHGIFLGSAMGLAFWSNLESAGQNRAVVLDSEDAAREFIGSWDEVPDGIELHDVMVDDDARYATIDQCVAAGLDVWDPYPPGTFAPAKRDMLRVLNYTENMLTELSAYAKHGDADGAQDWARRLGAMHMSLAWAASELGEAIGCTGRGDFARAELRLKAFTKRLHRAVGTISDEVWVKWRDGNPTTSSIVRIQRSNGAANDIMLPDDELH